jgi:hypothetical protein
MPRHPALERLLELGYPVCADGSMRLPPAPRRPVRMPPLRVQLAAVDRLSPRQRVRAMYRGELSYTQLCRWAARHPDEVALVDGEFIFIAVGLPEIADVILARRHVTTAQLSLAA